MSNGFALSTGSSCRQLASVGRWSRLNNAAPSVQLHYRAFVPNTSCSVPARRIGTRSLDDTAAPRPPVVSICRRWVGALPERARSPGTQDRASSTVGRMPPRNASDENQDRLLQGREPQRQVSEYTIRLPRIWLSAPAGSTRQRQHAVLGLQPGGQRFGAERCEARVSRTVLREADGEIPRPTHPFRPRLSRRRKPRPKRSSSSLTGVTLNVDRGTAAVQLGRRGWPVEDHR